MIMKKGLCAWNAGVGKSLEVYLLIPAELLYTETHEWVRKGENNRMTIGITEKGQNLLGDVLFLDLPAAGQKVVLKTSMASIESVNTVSDIYAPVSGEVIEVNDDLQYSPEWVNQDPFGKGWIAIIELTEAPGLEHLLSAEEYTKLTGV